MFDRIVEPQPNGPAPFKFNRAVVQRLAIYLGFYLAILAIKLIFAADWRPDAAAQKMFGTFNILAIVLGVRWVLQPGRKAA
jgi:hypothetical protein